MSMWILKGVEMTAVKNEQEKNTAVCQGVTLSTVVRRSALAESSCQISFGLPLN